MCDVDGELVEVCRDEDCQIEWVHDAHQQKGRRRRKQRLTRSQNAPWLVPCPKALRESVLAGVCSNEVRNFAVILDFVRNDYGSCCARSVHRHLQALQGTGEVVRLDFGGLYAYLRPDSRLLRDPVLVLEQLRDLQMVVRSR